MTYDLIPARRGNQDDGVALDRLLRHVLLNRVNRRTCLRKVLR